MNAKSSFLVKPISGLVCTFIVVSAALLSASSSIDVNILSHQPTTFELMERLVMPQDPAVEQALHEALGIGSSANSDNYFTPINDINKIWLWVYSNITWNSDYALHGVNDYWQTPAETLALKAGDCEDYAILMVSLMRAFGVPEGQVYVAVGYASNQDYHAFVIERYCYGAWTKFDPENLDDAVLLGSNVALQYNISYCFNDQGGFHGAPGYPRGYNPPLVSIVPVVPAPTPTIIYIPRVDSQNASLNEAKQYLGELWLPTFLPQGYTFYVGAALYNSGEWDFNLIYQDGKGGQLSISETIATGGLQRHMLLSETYEQVTINNQPAYVGSFIFATGTASSPSTLSVLFLDFIQGSLEMNIMGTPADSFSGEELIKIAESLVEY